MKAYFITGSTGFLGYNIIKQINNPDNLIIALVMKGDPNIHLFDSFKNIKIIEGNILNKEDVNKFLSYPFKGDKYLMHAAGKITTLKKGDPMVTKINFEGTKNIVDCSKDKGFQKIIYISSVDSLKYRKDKAIIHEQETYKEEDTVGIYGKSKVLASNYVRNNLNNYIVIMPSAILGPDDPLNSAINSAIHKIMNNKLPAIVKGGYNLVDVRDVASGILSVIDSDKINEDYLLTGHYISIKDLAKVVSELSHSKKPKFVVPHIIIKGIAPFITLHAKRQKKMPLFTGFSMDCLKQNANYSYEKANRDFSYQPRDLDVTILDTINFLKSKK